MSPQMEVYSVFNRLQISQDGLNSYHFILFNRGDFSNKSNLISVSLEDSVFIHSHFRTNSFLCHVSEWKLRELKFVIGAQWLLQEFLSPLITSKKSWNFGKRENWKQKVCQMI